MGLPVSDHRVPESGQTLDAHRGAEGSGGSRGAKRVRLDLGSFLVRVDADGRVQRTPATDKLARAARRLCNLAPLDWWSELREALADFDRESELLSSLVAEVDPTDPEVG